MDACLRCVALYFSKTQHILFDVYQQIEIKLHGLVAHVKVFVEH